MGVNGTAARVRIEEVAEIDSTNSELLRREPLMPAGSEASAILLVARSQTAGRGRRQRAWLSSPAASLTASFAREVRRPSHLGVLSLVAGVAVARALADFGADVRLKWPNDLHVPGGKAGGILCEARARGDVTRLVIGCGLNLLAPEDADFGQPVAGLFDAGPVPDRGRLCRTLGDALLDATDRLFAEGFEPFRRAWSDRDLLRSRAITIHDRGAEGAGADASSAGLGVPDVAGVAIGIDGDGALLVRLGNEGSPVRRLLSEEVSVRLRLED
jgi:BirA family biotin operon repressor/biotin-[acetyl-CoA-carboxylase] ligase